MPLMPLDGDNTSTDVFKPVEDNMGTDVFNREAYDELLDELDAQGDVSDILEESSEEEPPLELVSNFRVKVKEPVDNTAVTDELVNEFSAELGEPLGEGADTNPIEKQTSSFEDDLLDMAFDELDFVSDPLLNKDLGLEDESGEFLSGVRGDALLDELVGADVNPTDAFESASEDPLLGIDDTTEVFEPDRSSGRGFGYGECLGR